MPRKMTYGSYAARRIIRLWLPYAVLIVLAAAAIYFTGGRKITGQSAWLNGFLASGLSWHLLAQHFLMLGVFDTASLDFVIWSLVQEMRLSLLFPLIFWAVESGKPWVVLLASLLIEVMATYISHHFRSVIGNDSKGFASTDHTMVWQNFLQSLFMPYGHPAFDDQIAVSADAFHSDCHALHPGSINFCGDPELLCRAAGDYVEQKGGPGAAVAVN